METKAKIKRTPFELLDDLSIFCFTLRRRGVTLMKIGSILDKDHSTVLYHLKRYSNLSQVDKKFKIKAKEFDESEFLKKYKAYKKRGVRLLI